MSNSELAIRNSRLLAAKLAAEAESGDAFIQAAFEQVLSRPPSAAERAASRRFLERNARASFVQALFNHSDFVTIR